MSASCSEREHGVQGSNTGFCVLEAYAWDTGSHVDVYWKSDSNHYQTTVAVPHDDDNVWLYDVDGCLPIDVDDAENVLERALSAYKLWASHSRYCLCVECAPHLHRKEAVL